MPLQATSGAASYDAFGGGVPVVPNYIEDVFSTWLYTETGSAQTIPNGIDLAGKGGLVWIKSRSSGSSSHVLFDTNRGSNFLSTNTTSAQTSLSNFITYNSNGFDLSSFLYTPGSNNASWTFREQPKFFDVVTYTGTGSARTVAHNLGSVPGCIIIKRYSDSGWAWRVYHRSLGNTQGIYLDLTNAAVTSSSFWNNTDPTSTQFTVGDDGGVNGSGQTFVAYLFAHNAGGFGLTGTDNVISCGSVTANASAEVTVNLGWEPQLIIYKSTNAVGDWNIADNMRGWTANTTEQLLFPNNSAAESGGGNTRPLATGFGINPGNNTTYVYIAIRRGPMKTPTTGTSVFAPIAYTGNGGTQAITSNFPVDLAITDNRTKTSAAATDFKDRLRGRDRHLGSQYTYEEQVETDSFVLFDRSNSVGMGVGARTNDNGVSYVTRLLRRAPGFFDEVCYTGTGVARTVAHNLTVAPELMIVKARSLTGYGWFTYVASLGNTQFLRVNTTNAAASDGGGYWNSTSPTATVFSLADSVANNGSGSTYVAYLFASCPGVSKVFNYTGNGSSQTINCGFTGGARFVMIKRTDSTGDWYVWDSARGIVSGNDPRLSLNSTAAEVTTDDSVDTDSTGFVVNQLSATNINVSSATYIGIAIA